MARTVPQYAIAERRKRPVGAAGAQVPYKHKVTSSNLVPATMKSAGQPSTAGLFCLTRGMPRAFACESFDISLPASRNKKKTQLRRLTAKRFPLCLKMRRSISGAFRFVSTLSKRYSDRGLPRMLRRIAGEIEVYF